MLYFAYGSNMLTRRLIQRSSSARSLGVGSLSDRRLAWHKQSEDGSGKCDIPFHKGSVVYGVVFDVADEEIRKLDHIEGVGIGYEREVVPVVIEKRVVEAWSYRAIFINDSLVPYHWYKKMVIAGAREHSLPEPYIEQLEKIPSKADDDFARARRNEGLLIGC